jgi:hypothetical protein
VIDSRRTLRPLVRQALPDAERGGLVARQARRDQVRRARVQRRHGRGDDRPGRAGAGQRRTQRGEQVDDAEVVDRHGGGQRRGDPGAGDHGVDRPVGGVDRGLGGARPARRRRQVGGHLGVPQVDPDHAGVLGLQRGAGGGADPGGAARHDVRPGHGGLLVESSAPI